MSSFTFKFFIISRPPRPSINRVGILSGMEEPAEDSYDMTRPPRPTKPSTLIWPSSLPRKPPTGRPQSWDKKDDKYFPENNHVEERDPVNNEPEVINLGHTVGYIKL